MRVTSMGTLLVVGLTFLAAAQAEARVALDPGFSGDGRVTTTVGSGTSGARKLVRTDGGYLYAYGRTRQRDKDVTVVARYLHDGQLDFQWGSDGLAHGSEVTGDVGGFVVHRNNAVTVATSRPRTRQVVLERFTPRGDPDLSFGPGGAKVITLPAGEPYVSGLALQSSGKLIVAGHILEHGRQELFVMRVSGDGTRDASFGFGDQGPGTSSLALRSSDGATLVEATVTSVAIDAADRILVGGYYLGTTRNPAFVYRFSSGGGTGGLARMNFLSGTTAAVHSQVNDIAVHPDSGMIAVAGYALFGTSGYGAVARLTSDLRRDDAFDGDGRRLLSFNSEGNYAAAVAWGPHQWIYTGGTSWNSGDAKFAVARLRANGDYDNAFDGDGKIVTDFPGTSEWLSSLVVSPTTGLPVVGGSSSYGGIDEFALARYADVP